MFMEFIIQNKRAEKRIEFPCDEDKYQLICKDLKLTDNRVFIKSVENIFIKTSQGLNEP